MDRHITKVFDLAMAKHLFQFQFTTGIKGGINLLVQTYISVVPSRINDIASKLQLYTQCLQNKIKFHQFIDCTSHHHSIRYTALTSVPIRDGGLGVYNPQQMAFTNFRRPLYQLILLNQLYCAVSVLWLLTIFWKLINSSYYLYCKLLALKVF
jgi:hypothetical protein